MRSLVYILCGIALILPLFADQPTIKPDHSFTLISVSNPGCAIAEVDSLCLVAAQGEVQPLRLKIVQGNGNPKCVSLESEAYPGYFLRHQDSRLKLHPYAENDWVFAGDSTFYLVHNQDGTVSFQSYNFPQQYISVTASKKLYIATDPPLPGRSFILGP
jgi:hypothetical protein